MTFANLPTELALAIFEHAAHAHIIGDRQWVVQLALVSNAAYKMVRPSLYHTLIITDRNYQHFKSSNPPESILPFVRSVLVFIDTDRLHLVHDDLRQCFSRWAPPSDAQAHVDLPWPIARIILNPLQDLHSKPLCIIASMLIRYELLHCAVLQAYTTSMPVAIATKLKQIGGFVPVIGEWYTDPGSLSSSPRGWGQAVLDSLPALRRIVFKVMAIDYFSEYTYGLTEYLLEVREMVQRVFEHRPSLKVTILFGGDYLLHEEEVRTLLEGLCLQYTLNIWFDQRTTSWTDMNKANFEDGCTERDIWSSPPPLVLSDPLVKPR